MNVLVTGGAGFIGSNFVRLALAERPRWRITNLDLLSYAGNLENLADVERSCRYRFVRGDVADRKGLEPLFRRGRFDAVIHFAAESHVDRSILDAAPFIETNVRGTQALLEAATAHGVKRFVQISTDEVYGSIRRGTFTEESPLRPNSPYSASKAGADLLALAWHRTFGLPVIVTRSSNNYGPFQFPEKLIPLMIRNILEEKPLPVYGRGRNIRDWLYVEDNCRGVLRVAERGRPGEVYNIGGGEERPNLEIVHRLCDIAARRLGRPRAAARALIRFVKDRPGHDFRYSLSSRKIGRDLGWRPAMTLEVGLERTVDWYLAHREWIRSVISGEYRRCYRQIYDRGWRKGRA
ncbi:MAG: dTDP-glucose 4,6-dehydratase [Planctomycetota bacterium]